MLYDMACNRHWGYLPSPGCWCTVYVLLVICGINLIISREDSCLYGVVLPLLALIHGHVVLKGCMHPVRFATFVVPRQLHTSAKHHFTAV